MTWRTLILGMTGVAAIAFLAGVDDGLNKADQATRADRLRIVCASPGPHELPCVPFRGSVLATGPVVSHGR